MINSLAPNQGQNTEENDCPHVSHLVYINIILEDFNSWINIFSGNFDKVEFRLFSALEWLWFQNLNLAS